MNLRQIKETPLPRKTRKRVGRGIGSGSGKTCGRGHKGARARAGFGGLIGYEGGQTPLFRRLPKRGFSNADFRLRFAIVNVSDLSDFAAGTEVTPELLLKKRKVRKLLDGVKILGGGALDVPLKVHAHRFSDTAIVKIEEAGGEVKKL
jgi:large subunit ribosomal protein L15